MITESSMALGRDWAGEPIAGWIATEKHDGVRAFWDGSAFWTRSGNAITAPAWFTDGLAGAHLDCEIHAGPGGFIAARNAVNHGRWHAGIRLAVFDAPGVPAPYQERLVAARRLAAGASHAFVPVDTEVRDLEHARELLEAVQAMGGEGLVIRHPSNPYTPGRTPDFLKMVR